MGDIEKYEAPFCPATQQGEPCVCIVCGNVAIADHRISEYPFRYVPKSWSVSARRSGLRCDRCTREELVHPEFYNNNEVWITYDCARIACLR